MGRILMFVLLGIAGYFLFRSVSRSTPDETPVERERRPELAAEDMVLCRVCGVNLPKTEAMTVSGGYTCRDGEQCPNRKPH